MEPRKFNSVVGDAFEELKIDEMTEMQGAGDMDAESTPVLLSVSAALTGAVASYQLSHDVVKSIKNSRC